jgi:hypothetical protein
VGVRQEGWTLGRARLASTSLTASYVLPACGGGLGVGGWGLGVGVLGFGVGGWGLGVEVGVSCFENAKHVQVIR